MTDDRDPQARGIAGAYRGANRALDERPDPSTRSAILAAAARAIEAKPQPVGATPARRWRVRLAAAATVLISTIAVIVAQRTEREMPAEVLAERAPPAQTADAAIPVEPQTQATPVPEAAPPRTRAPRRAEPPAAAKAETEPPRAAEAPQIAAAAPEPQREAAPPAADAAGQPLIAPEAQSRERRADSLERSAGAPAMAAKESEPPERWLARIIELRQAARDDEADAELKKLRERHPDLKIPEAALRRTGTR